MLWRPSMDRDRSGREQARVRERVPLPADRRVAAAHQQVLVEGAARLRRRSGVLHDLHPDAGQPRLGALAARGPRDPRRAVRTLATPVEFTCTHTLGGGSSGANRIRRVPPPEPGLAAWTRNQ